MSFFEDWESQSLSMSLKKDEKERLRRQIDLLRIKSSVELSLAALGGPVEEEKSDSDADEDQPYLEESVGDAQQKSLSLAGSEELNFSQEELKSAERADSDQEADLAMRQLENL